MDKLKLLIVDDEQLTRTFLKNIIPTLCEQWEIVGEAMNGTEALDILSCNLVDLVLTDIKMPEMDGLELCKQIYNLYPDIQCIILSGYGEFNYAKDAMKYNVSNYLLKPIINDELKTVLNTVAKKCHENICEQSKYNHLMIASKKYKEEITEKFLKAIITSSHIEIQSLYPVLYDLNINIIEAECVTVILQVTENILLENNIDLSNLTLLNLLLYNTAKKYASTSSIKVFIDSEENTVLLIPLSETDNMHAVIEDTYNSIQKIYFEETKLNIYCLAGSTENELLQINTSYNNAKKAFLQSLFNYDTNFIKVYCDNLYENEINLLHSYITNLIYSIHSNDIMNIDVVSNNIGIFLFEKIDQHCLQIALNYIVQQIKLSIHFKETINNEIYLLLSNSNNTYNDSKNICLLIKQITSICISNRVNTNVCCDENLLVDQTKQYIHNHYMDPISLSLIADKLCVSSSYLSNLFHKSEGKSYIKFLTEVRLKHSINLLKNKSFTLDTISKKVGYISVKHFSYVFKKYYHITPGEYRKNYR
ncbi:MAG: response regulator [Vallitalea sp.]|jgi:two-component system response regulator YesN|nr:response regulator [Vallitalea sp.]